MNAFELTMGALSIDRAVIEKLGWTLLHFLWQGAIVAAVLALLDMVLARARSQYRYAAACAALLVMLALPIATWLGTGRPEPRASTPAVAGGVRARVARPATLDRMRFARPTVTRAPISNPSAQAGRRATPSFDALRARLAASRLLPVLVACWAFGVVLLSLRLLGGWWLVTRLGRSTYNVPIEAWQPALDELARRMGVSRPVRLVRSALVQVPTALGWLSPVILLPASTLTGLSSTQITAILAHELAHIRRHDYLVNLLQSVIETLLFYHPAVWWVSRRIREERELCCDDLAVRASGDAVSYARALCELERLRGEGAPLALAANGGSLVARIARLLGASRRPHLEAVRGLAWAVIALLVVVAGVAGGAVRVNERVPYETRRLLHESAERLKPAVTVVRAVAAAAPKAVVTMAPAIAAAVPTVAVVPSVAVPAVLTPVVPATPVVDAVVACEPPREENSAAPEAPSDRTRDRSRRMLEVGFPEQTYSGNDWERLVNAGASADYVSKMASAGYRNLSVDELISLATHGVSAEYAGNVRRELGDVDVDQLVQLANHGVSSTYIAGMRKSVGDIDVDDLVQLANHGISPEYVAGMREMDLDDLSVDDLVRLANSGVSLEWFAAMRWLGYSDFTVERAIQLRNAGVTPDYAASLTVLSRHRLTLDELRTLRTQGVDVEYAATLLNLLRQDLTVDELIRLRQQGVTIEYVAAMNALGFEKLTCDDLVQLRQQGVEPEYVAAMNHIGLGPLTTRDLVRLRQNGVTPDFVEEVRDAGLEINDVSRLIRMRQIGIPKSDEKP